MELSTEDKERIEQQLDALFEHFYHDKELTVRQIMFKIVEYATIYEREQQVALQTENSIYFQERNEAWKQNAQLEAERSELKEQLKELTLFVQRYSNTIPHRIKKIITPILKEIDENQ